MKHLFFTTCLFLSQNAFSIEGVHFFSEQIKDETISSRDETLLIFPSPPLASACQPMGVLDITLQEESEVFNPRAGPAQIARAACLADGTCSEEAEKKEILAKLLKAVPIKGSQSSSTTCGFRLAGGESFSVRFVLDESIHKPKIEFKNLYQTADKAQDVTKALGGLNVFRSLLSGEKPTYLIDLTAKMRTSDNTSHRVYWTKYGRYTLMYYGTDKSRYAAWQYHVTAKETSKIEKLKPKQLGQILYSALIPNKEGAYKFFLLTRSDVTAKEIEAILP